MSLRSQLNKTAKENKNRDYQGEFDGIVALMKEKAEKGETSLTMITISEGAINMLKKEGISVERKGRVIVLSFGPPTSQEVIDFYDK